MANDQFRIPDTFVDKPLQEALLAAESIEHTPDKIEGMYAFNPKAHEARIHGYRKTALDIEANRKKGLLETLLGIARLRVTLKSLLESESYIGGEPFGPHNRFWLSHKGSGAHGSNNDIGDWYHVREIYDSFGRKINELTIHFETHPTHIIKFYDGRPVNMSVAELETFLKAVDLYEKNVRERLYPLDQEIYDLNTEIEQENVTIPDTVEEMFGKKVVARMIENFKARKGITESSIPNTVEEMFGAEAVQQITDDVRTKL